MLVSNFRSYGRFRLVDSQGYYEAHETIPLDGIYKCPMLECVADSYLTIGYYETYANIPLDV